MEDKLSIRKAATADLDNLYAFAKDFSELRVSGTNEFMDKDEFEFALTNKTGIFLVAEINSQLVGFIYANINDPEKRSLEKKWACLVYLAIKDEFRKQGIAQKLYDECIRILKNVGITNIYTWANIEGDGAIVGFMEKQGFLTGHKYMWMDKKI